MGGRGSKSGLLRAPRLNMPQPQQPPQVQPPQPPQPQPDLTPGSDLQTATQATATLAQIASMTDDQLAQAYLDSRNVDRRVYIPYKMGCGIAGGDWGIVRNIIKDVFGKSDVEAVIVRRPGD